MARADGGAATARRAERVAELRERYGVEPRSRTTTPPAGASLVVIAVKPQDIEGLLGEIGTLILPEQTVLSVAAAIPTSRIESRLSDRVPVVRAMPNTPSTVHEGIAGPLAAGAHAGDEHLDLAEEALSHLGGVVRVPEKALDAITAVSGSGPAYFALLAEAMIEAGILLGLSREISTQLVVQTMLGTAKQLRDEKMHPVELREMVTSPGGTTIAAIRELEMAGVRAAFLNAIQAAMVRARELAAGDRLGSHRRSSRGGRVERDHDPALGRAPAARARCRPPGVSSRNSSRASKSATSARIATLVRRGVARRESRERVGTAGGIDSAPGASTAGERSGLVVVTEHELARAPRIPADRALRLGGAGLERPLASSRAPSRSPAISRDFIAPIGLPQLPAGASGQLSRYVSAARIEPLVASSRRPSISSARPAAHAALPIRVSWRCRSSPSSGSRAAPSS